jgi:FMN-dependent NADH-azoreductase
MKLLHIISTPRNHVSNTLRVSNKVIETYKAQYPDLEVQDLNLFQEDLPAATGDIIESKYMLMSHLEIDQLKRQSWSEVEGHIAQFLSADIYVLSTPMWNFGIPYVLKFYIDTIVQPNYLFRYTPEGQVEGLAKNKKMIVVTSRGGDYSASSPMHIYDFQEPYLRAIFGLVGITNIQFINLQPMDISKEIREAKIAEALNSVESVVNQLEASLTTA